MMFMRKTSGFTLIEMMIVVAIMAILAAVAYFNYTNYAFRARRADAHETLMRVAAAQERYYTNFNRYATTAQLDLGGDPVPSTKGHYNVASANGTTGDAQSYTLTATPTGVQANDKCLNLTLTNTGVKNKSGAETNGKCW